MASCTRAISGRAWRTGRQRSSCRTGQLAGDFVDGVMHGRLVGHYDKELQEERDEKGEIIDEDAWRFKGEEIELSKRENYVSPTAQASFGQGEEAEHLANRGKGKDRRSVVSRKLYNDGKASGSWAFEGYYRDGYREGHGTEKYEEKVVGRDKESTNFRWLEEITGTYKKGRIQGLGMYTTGPKGSVLWPCPTTRTPSSLDPVVYEEQHHRAVAIERMFVVSKREGLKQFRKHRDVVKKMEKRNKEYYETAVQAQRMEFFDEDIWELMTGGACRRDPVPARAGGAENDERHARLAPEKVARSCF